MAEIAARPPLVFPGEVDKLRHHIALAAEGRNFVLQGGDCVERFLDCRAETIANKLKILLQMSVILTHAARRPVVRVGRMAGQFAKPRTSDTDVVDGREIPSYKGDLINDYVAKPADREPDPARLLEGYHHAVATLNYIRAMINGGFADLHHPYTWNLHAIEQTEQWPEYRQIVEHILDAIAFMESFGGADPDQLGAVEFFTSHEGLHLGYEQALTRVDEGSGRPYNLGAHMLWIGNRTRAVDGAHVEYFRGIANPIGVKIGSDIEGGEVRRLLDVLDPRAEAGRITLITRLGADRVDELLPPLISEVRATGCPVAWSCDPMHGNTRTASGGRKTRQFDDVLREVRETFRVHAEQESRLAGIHFELTADPVTECTGGAVGLSERDLASNYQSWCDPRLNYAQSMEMAFLVSRLLRG